MRRYRIELLVLSHLNPPADVVPDTAISDYSASLDLTKPPPEASEDATGSDVTGAAADAAAPQAGEDSALAASEEEIEDPLAVVWLETPSELMDQAWRRLRSSSGFRPEVYFSWEQSNVQPFPLLRVHDATVLFEEDPFAELRLLAARSPLPVSESASDSGEALPEPLLFYRIDGTASLRKTRFLHLDLDLQLRVPVRGTESGMPEAGLSRDSAFDVFPIRQSRRIQTQNVEYFDGPVLGVLALITRVDPEPGEEEIDGETSGDIASEIMADDSEPAEPADAALPDSMDPGMAGDEEAPSD